MHSWHDVKISRVTPSDFLAVIEISKGSKNKYELDKETGHLKTMVLFHVHSRMIMTHLMS